MAAVIAISNLTNTCASGLQAFHRVDDTLAEALVTLGYMIAGAVIQDSAISMAQLIDRALPVITKSKAETSAKKYTLLASR